MAEEGRPAALGWVRWGAAALGALLLVAVGLALSGQGHGPGRHLGHDMAPAGEDAP